MKSHQVLRAVPGGTSEFIQGGDATLFPGLPIADVTPVTQQRQTDGGGRPPDTEYAQTHDGAHIAYQVCGDGPLDLVFERGIGSHVELAWEISALARVFRRLASFSRLIRFDHRGMGMSDPLGRSDPRSLEGRAGEVLAVLDAVGSERGALVANNFGGPMAILFAATYPNRTASLVLDGCYGRLARAPDYPWGVPNEVLERALARVRDAQLSGDAGDVSGLRYLAPHAMQDSEFVAQWRRYSRYTSSPSAAAAEAEVGIYTDVRALLPLVQAPTLVLYRRDDLFDGRPHAEYLAAHIPGAKLVEVPGADDFIFAGDSEADLDEIEEFLTGARQSYATDRVLATVMFTDIVASTERAAEVGDRNGAICSTPMIGSSVENLNDSVGGKSTPSATGSSPPSTGREGPFSVHAPFVKRFGRWVSKCGPDCTLARSKCGAPMWPGWLSTSAPESLRRQAQARCLPRGRCRPLLSAPASLLPTGASTS